ncbi:MAG: hypothetical protein E6J01_12680 [Chloroflexi bacterium]|nr:MAG: hypothetical protein E6J01_12680 [Chloroflexota bacterium]
MAKAQFHRGGLLAISAAVLIVTFASGYALGHGTTHQASAGAGACTWTTFPSYPNVTALPRPANAGVAYRTFAPASRVARFYQAGAGQTAWTFVPTQDGGPTWVFHFTENSGCHGILTVQADQAGGTVVEANPTSTAD